MSELKTNKISPAVGTGVTLGDSGDTFTIPAGVTITNSGTATGFGGGKVVQMVHTSDTAVSTSTTIIPFDDTIPQNTEGTEYLTLSITPTNASNQLVIEGLQIVGVSVGRMVIGGVFQDSTANPVYVFSKYVQAANATNQVNFRYAMTAGTTSSTTFKIRLGLNTTGTLTYNGSGGSREFGGVASSSITITEISA